jgi:hypothetical protein
MAIGDAIDQDQQVYFAHDQKFAISNSSCHDNSELIHAVMI